MKRALTAAVFGGLLAIAVPQVAFADHNAEHSAEHKGDSAEAPKSEPEGAPESEQAPPRHGDKESHDDGSELF